MKKTEYKSKKWDKKLQIIIESNAIELCKKEIEETEVAQYDEIKRKVVLCSEYYGLALCYYMEENTQLCNEYLVNAIDKMTEALELEEKIETMKAIKMSLEKVKGGRVEVFVAYVVDKFEQIKKYLYFNNIEEYFENLDNKTLQDIYKAIKEKKQELFESAIEKRIAEIRKMSVDYLIIVDFWTLSLMKYAIQKGLVLNDQYIELGFKYSDKNVFIDNYYV